jgi:hypothetical protein
MLLTTNITLRLVPTMHIYECLQVFLYFQMSVAQRTISFLTILLVFLAFYMCVGARGNYG